jgi:2-polyprenyl-6-methoxyphenol hydroxylase-like FAD-dependent oxidoreductase
MIIRDLEILEQILKSKIDLGLDLGDTTALNEFSERVKYKNFVFANLIDLTHYIFSKKNTFFKKIRNFTLDQINQQTKVKNFFLTVADRGLRF